MPAFIWFEFNKESVFIDFLCVRNEATAIFFIFGGKTFSLHADKNNIKIRIRTNGVIVGRITKAGL